MNTSLKQLFDQWGTSADPAYAGRQWLLSKWEVQEGIDWTEPKIDLLIGQIKEALALSPQDRLIELGCGGGWILERLAATAADCRGLDFSRPMLKFAPASLKGKLICGEIGSLPLADRSFDKVLSYYVFMNFADDAYVARSLKEIHRILKKGGRALIGQLPDARASARYEQERTRYAAYCAGAFRMGKSIREAFRPPLRLFDRDVLAGWLEQEGIAYRFRDAFNPFYRAGEPETVDWRFDLLITKDN